MLLNQFILIDLLRNCSQRVYFLSMMELEAM